MMPRRGQPLQSPARWRSPRRRDRLLLSGSATCPATDFPSLPHGAPERQAADADRPPIHGAEPFRPKPARGLRSATAIDLALLHAPSVLDFRRREALLGPVADVVPSSDEFEMYPMGLTSLAGYLSRNNYNVRIVNVAYRMLRSRRYGVARHLSRIRSPVYGIDLHWLPHANGALGLAELVKTIHPGSKVLLGGLSASYYHEELINLPYVDFVLRGDSTEEPARQLLQALRERRPLEEVQNLTWKRPDGSIVVNPLSFVPADLDYVDVPDYDYALKAVFKYWDLADLVPYLRWLKNPTTLVLNARGCTYDCAICGGSRSAYRKICARQRPAFRTPEKLVSDMKTIASFSAAPIFMVHDPRMGGIPRARRIFELLKEAEIPNELVIEIFFPAHDEFFAMVERSTRAWSMEITIESPDESLRRVNGKFPCANAEIESSLEAALAHGCGKIDLFFMIGVPHQTPAQALGTIDYCEHLIERFGADLRLQFYAAPLGPFLDPGSRAFEDPTIGYRKRFATLAEHRRALEALDWREILSFDTDTMDRRDLVNTTYEVAGRLNELKYRHRLTDLPTYTSVRDHLEMARQVLEVLDHTEGLPVPERESILRQMHAKVAAANKGSISGPDELHWKPSTGIRVSRSLLTYLVLALGREVPKAIARLRGLYDVDVYEPPGALNIGNVPPTQVESRFTG